MRLCAARSTVSDCVLNTVVSNLTTNLCNRLPARTQKQHTIRHNESIGVCLQPNSSSTASFNSFRQHNNLLYICLLVLLCLYKTHAGDDCCLDNTRLSDTSPLHIHTNGSSHKNNASVNKPQYRATLKYCTYIHKYTHWLCAFFCTVCELLRVPVCVCECAGVTAREMCIETLISCRNTKKTEMMKIKQEEGN